VLGLALIAAGALLLAPAGASAASPILEFVVPGHPFPVAFTTEGGALRAEMAGFESLVHCTASHGEGEITGPRSAVAKFTFTGCTTEKPSAKCHSLGAGEEEITAGPIDAELVFINQARREVAMLLNPGGGTYISFKCGGEDAEGTGAFLAPVAPIDQEATAFTATLNEVGSIQTPDEYENASDEKLQAVPHGKHGTAELVTTGVASTFAIHSSVSGQIRAISSSEVEAAQGETEAQHKREAEAAKAREELQRVEAALKKVEERAKQLEEANKRLEAEKPVKVTGAPAHRPVSRSRAEALRRCKKLPRKQIARCEARVKKKYGGATKPKGR
jgi:hypothetical protein